MQLRLKIIIYILVKYEAKFDWIRFLLKATRLENSERLIKRNLPPFSVSRTPGT